jgi:hypothetical protein
MTGESVLLQAELTWTTITEICANEYDQPRKRERTTRYERRTQISGVAHDLFAVGNRNPSFDNRLLPIDSAYRSIVTQKVLPRRCRLGEAPIPLETRSDNR